MLYSLRSMRTDYYQLLDVRETATQAEIKAGYRRQAMRYHPDHNAGNTDAEERFKLVAEAYRVLGDLEEREQYDRWLDRQLRLSAAPELASMPRRARMCPRHGYARRSGHTLHRSHRSSTRTILLRPRSRGSLISYLLFYMLCLGALFAFLLSHMMRATEPKKYVPMPEPGVSPLDEQTQLKRLAEFTERILQQAQAGKAREQFRYGVSCLMVRGVEQNRAAAVIWWQKAAEQGYRPAIEALEKVLAVPSVSGDSQLRSAAPSQPPDPAAEADVMAPDQS